MVSTTTRGPGRPAAASREDVMAAAMRRFLRGQRIDVQAIAAELGLGRTTIYRWFGTREELMGHVLVRATEPLMVAAREQARGTGSARLLDAFDRFNRSLAGAEALRTLIEQERETALRIIASDRGVVRPAMVTMITEMIEAEAGYRPAAEPATLAYAIVRLAEAFLYNEDAAEMRGEVDRLREVEAALLGVS
jgi:AcrR family transcriptional regulator